MKILFQLIESINATEIKSNGRNFTWIKNKSVGIFREQRVYNEAYHSKIKFEGTKLSFALYDLYFADVLQTNGTAVIVGQISGIDYI